MPLTDILAQFPLCHIDTALGRMSWREAGGLATPSTPIDVLLHGIGSGSASWVCQLEAASLMSMAGQSARLLAWDAPGYADSSALDMPWPMAADYAQRLWDWLDALGLAQHRVTLVGHSLGCLMATAATVMAPNRVSRLVLLSPAQGYARATRLERDKKLDDRLANLAQLGPHGMAQLRGAAMLSASATSEQIAFVQQVMAQIKPDGYTQAARMLSRGDLLTDLAQVTCPVQVASGSADGITPSAGCMAVAAHVNAPYTSLADVGHICAMQAADEVSQLLDLTGLCVDAGRQAEA